MKDQEPALLSETRDGILLLTLNRPQARNAISPEMACRLSDAFAAFAEDPDQRVCILTGAGDKAFCSGGDLALTLPLLTGARKPETEWDHRVLDDPTVMSRSALRNFELNKPIIAAINGACLAGGMETMLATDIRIAASHATFGLPEAKRALIPFAGSLVRLPRQVSYCVAMEMLLVGDSLDAESARLAGLVNYVVPPEEVLPRAWALATKIAANGPVAVSEIKRTVLASSGRTLEEGYALEDAAKDRVMATSDAREGPRAFMEKRQPAYVGR
ncbi:enoyl-CoA hydratase-related protein [Rhizobium sp. NTR19]|uniref:Enoyl-CoA hydratase-related protein n=1 Tax=Neorhizobium turbinariae TaxID=2937795 RepID=A0ABT0INH7_9HYPH|nr:enoyl-CoA hydratase-related protein [Neorhizobium turbinariae]MCK8779442.1 enoyl-CoA hydratase-related protein [Neorhizobium turbinariae]